MKTIHKPAWAPDIPAYELGVLAFGVASVAQILYALSDLPFSNWRAAGLCVTLLITTFLAYKANRTPS